MQSAREQQKEKEGKKMAKKLCALFLFCCMVVGMSTPCAAATPVEEMFKVTLIDEHTLQPMVDSLDLMENGGFEYLADEKTPSKWGLSAPNDQSFLGSENIILNDTRLTDAPAENKIVEEGYRAIHFKNKEKGLTMAVGGAYILRSPGQVAYNCELGVSFYMLSDKAGVSMEVLVTLQDEEGKDVEQRFGISFTNDMKKGEWVRKIVSMELPLSARYIGLQPRLSTEGEVIMDNVTLYQTCDQEFIDAKKPREKMPPVPGTPANMLGLKYPGGDGNTGFETTQEGDTPWLLQHLDTPADIRFSTDENHTPGGKQSLLLQNITNIRGRAYQNVYDFVPGATYQISWWYKIAGPVQTTVSYEMRWFPCEKPWDEPDLGLASGDGLTAWQDPENQWKEFSHTFVAPYPPDKDDPLSAEICIRIGGKNASAYFDDVELYMVKEPDAATIRSDEAIYYTEYPYGTVDAEVADYYAEKMVGGSMRYWILDGEKVIVEPQTVPFVEEDETLVASGSFPTSVMQANKKGQTYSYVAEILDPAGNVLQTQQSAIYRFDRPKYLGVDGIFRKNGKEYHVGTGNSCNTDRIKQGVKDGGLEVIMMVGEGELTLLEKLDAAHEAGLLVILNMGDSNACAGSPSRIMGTIDTVNMVKDHPALFGYKIQDEPIQKRTPEEHLLAGYVAIRELDPNHVVYSCDGVEGDFPILARYTDYMESDSYTGNSKSASHIVNTINLAEEASRGRKPVGILQKAYEVAPADVYFPTYEEFRHYGYQCLIAGGGGWGYHAIGKNGTGVPLIEREVWKEIVEWEASGEQDLMFACMVEGKYPLINSYVSDELIWHLYAVDGKLYAIVVNCVGGVGNKEGSLTVDIPLTDAANAKALGDFTATLKYGGEGSASGKDTLSIEIPSFAAEVWEITLANPVDFSGHKITKYNDIDLAPWAYQAVAKLQEAKVINRDIDMRYEPQKQITRGDYAMFLVNALGLTADATENFADVKPYAEYANALAIGRALGIFNGRGDNLYDPEKPAPRAELMALTARALRLVGKAADGDAASLDAFSDKALIPEWAAGDVAAMVSMGIVKGNADGTVNPGGNTTRAEAAVIIDRVMTK